MKHTQQHHRLPWIAGMLALLWLLLRSGGNPKRLSYPCQQAAIPIAANWLLSVAAFVTGSVALRRFAKCSGATILLIGVIWFSVSFFDLTIARNPAIERPPSWEVPNPVSKVFLIDTLPPTNGTLAAGDSTVPDEYLSDPAIDALVMHMQSQGISLYKSVIRPDGIVGANDIVLIKPNFYFEGKNTTNTDRIKGIIWAILNHPVGFTGEIIVFENTQGGPIDDNDNNSDDPNQSIVDVINTFRAKHYPVFLKNCTLFRTVDGSEYFDGDYTDCFVYDPINMYTWPKFKSPSGRHYISLRHGIWDSTSATYDTTRKCIIDMPVLKSHSWAGATIVIKNYVGYGSTAYDERWGGFTSMHQNYFWGRHALLARAISTAFPRLSIVDAKWTNNNGPGGSSWLYTNMLVASTDPIAADWYSAKYILTPLMQYPHWTNPDFPGGLYNGVLGNWTRYLQDSTSRVVTKDSNEISVYRWAWGAVPIQLSQFSGTVLTNGEVLLEWITISEVNNYGFFVQRRTTTSLPWTEIQNSFVPGHGTTTERQTYRYIDRSAPRTQLQYRLRQVDLDGTVHYTDPITVGSITAVGQHNAFEFSLRQNYPNPFNPSTTLEYEIAHPGPISLIVVDISGRRVATLVEGIKTPGRYTIRWDASQYASGFYFCRMTSGNNSATRRMLLVR